MKLKGVVAEDFVNYKNPAMFIIFPNCSFKCCTEAGVDVCQNMDVVKLPDIEFSTESIVQSYLNNDITKAIVFGGMEPFDSISDLIELIKAFRQETDDPIIIYTGYKEEEIFDDCNGISMYENIIVKFGRFIPNSEPIYDEVLGVTLNSNNQYAKRL